MDRDPCPYRIFDDVGGAFALGAGGGTIWHLVKGWRNSPRGERMLGMTTAVKVRAPVLGGNFAVWGLLFSSFDCTLVGIRKKEDPWNSITAGACTSGLLAIRAGRKAVAKNFVIGGVLLALIEGLGIAITRSLAPPEPSFEQPGATQNAAPPSVSVVLGGSNMPTGAESAPDMSQASFDVSRTAGDAGMEYR